MKRTKLAMKWTTSLKYLPSQKTDLKQNLMLYMSTGKSVPFISRFVHFISLICYNIRQEDSFGQLGH